MFELSPSLVICAYFVCAGCFFTAAYLLYITWHSNGKISHKVYMTLVNKSKTNLLIAAYALYLWLTQGYSELLEALFDYIFG